MSQIVLNVGSGPNAGNGDQLRNAMIKVNNNFTELFTHANTVSQHISFSANTTTFSGDVVATLIGNASAAHSFVTPRRINGTYFDGSADITTAQWGEARTLGFTGDATGSHTVDGSGDTSIALTLSETGVTAGIYGSSNSVPVISVDAKGRVTSITTTAVSGGSGSIPDILHPFLLMGA